MIGTLHAHAYRALKFPDLAESREGMAAWNDWCLANNENRFAVSERYAQDPENAPPEGPIIATDGERMLAELGVLRARMTPTELWPTTIQHFARTWDTYKRETRRLDFSDLIEQVIARGTLPPSNPKVMMLDEGQDMSRLELTMARFWGGLCDTFVLVGDPYQNLYEWRGSEPEAFYAGRIETERVLHQSYRVPRAVHSYAVDFAQPLVPEGREFPRYEPRDADGEVRRGELRWRDPEPIVRQVLDDLEEFPDTDAQDHPTVMILASCGFMLDPTLQALKAEGIPLANPYRPTAGNWNPMRAANRILAFLRPDVEVFGDEHRLWTWDELRLWTEPLRAAGILNRGAKVGIGVACKARDGARKDEVVEIADLLRLFSDKAMDAVFGMDLDWWGDNLLGSGTSGLTYPLNVARQRGKAALRERPRVCVGTIHSVKGGQADSVYVFPDLSRQGYYGSWTKPEGRPAVLRQFYVAFTRARTRLTICEQSGQEYVPLPTPKEST